MNRAEFMRRLTGLLGDVSPIERNEAIQYYNDYFDDAGAENENSVIASLGSPEELARTIKAGLNDGGNSGEFTESGFNGYTQVHRDEMVRAGETKQSGNAYGGREDTRKYNNPYGQNNFGNSANPSGNASGNPAGGQYTQPKKGMSGGNIVLIVILAVLTSPVWIGLLGGAIGIVGGLLAALFGIFVAFLAIGIVLIIVSFALLITGVAMIFTVPLGGVCMVGSALIVFSIGLVFVWLMVMMAGTAIPAAVKGVASLWRRLFGRGGVPA